MNDGLLPSIDNEIQEKDFCIKVSKDEYTNVINKSLSNYINQVKHEIHRNNVEWEVFKKYTNPYEFIYSNMNNLSVSTLKPISRAYYKMIEIIYKFDLFKGRQERKIKTFHLAEGPGGFIEAVASTRKNKEDEYYGITLLDTDNSKVPSWDKSTRFLSQYKNVILEKGVDGTGNLFSYDNLVDIIQHHQGTMDIVTGDGGFDFSNDYNNQETQALLLIYSQIIYALFLQKQGGHFILKVFDIFKKPTIDLIYILSLFYKKVYIQKLHTSRIANSEKYVVCKYFKYSSIQPLAERLFHIFKVTHNIDTHKYSITSFLSCPIPLQYKKAIEYINSYYGEQQLNNINFTLSLIRSKNKDKIDKLKNDNIKRCIEWCIKHRIPYQKVRVENVFMS